MSTLEIVLIVISVLLLLSLVAVVLASSKKKVVTDNKAVLDRLNNIENGLKMDIQNATNHTGTVMVNTLSSIGKNINDTVTNSNKFQNEKLDALNNSFIRSVEENRAIEQANTEAVANILKDNNAQNIASERVLREVLDKKLTEINEDTKQKLTEVKQVVDEKLTSTINERFNSSFKIVNESLTNVLEGFKQMQDLSSGVTDLNKMLSNVKTRGVWGENTLDAILEDMFTVDQYGRSVNIQGNNMVDFAIKLPGKDKNEILLPIDSKFPIEDYYRLVEVEESGNKEQIEKQVKELANAVKKQARSIRDKYIVPPKTTNFAIMFVPTESLYAEILKINDLSESIQRECRVVIAGPTTISALLNSLQMGFKTLAIQKSSEEIWKMFNQFRKDFANFTDNLDKMQKKINEVSNTIEQTTKRSNLIRERLDKVEQIQIEE